MNKKVVSMFLAAGLFVGTGCGPQLKGQGFDNKTSALTCPITGAVNSIEELGSKSYWGENNAYYHSATAHIRPKGNPGGDIAIYLDRQNRDTLVSLEQVLKNAFENRRYVELRYKTQGDCNPNTTPILEKTITAAVIGDKL